MLVLSRQAGESLQIGDDIEISVLEIRGSVVKIGVTAPRQVAIYRSELEQLNRRATLDRWREHGQLASIAVRLRNRK